MSGMRTKGSMTAAGAVQVADIGGDARPTLDDLYRHYAGELRKAVRKSFGAGPPEPDDVVQAAFARYATLDDPAKVRNPRAFLYTTARNIVLDHKRGQRRTDAFIDEVLAEAGQQVDKITPEDVLLHREQFDIMVAVMRRLPKKQRVVLTMSRLHGHSYGQIARVTGWSVSDIGRQLNAGLETIDDALRRANRRGRRGR